MKLLIILVSFSVALSAPQGYSSSSNSFSSSSALNDHFSSSASSSSSGYSAPSSNNGGGGGSSGGYGPSSCPEGQVIGADGECTEPIINRNIFVFAAPQIEREPKQRPTIPKPKINFNIVFVRTPEAPEDEEPIIIPPAQQQTVVYVLNKNQENDGPQIINLPDQPTAPEVFYINYRDGDNPKLPGGLDLQSALASANNKNGQVIETSGGGGGYNNGGNGFSVSNGYAPPTSH